MATMFRYLSTMCCLRSPQTYTYHDAMQRKIRLAILECDTALPQTAQKYGGYGGCFKALLSAGAKAEGYCNVDEILDISIHHVEEMDSSAYPNMDEVDALLLTGSRHDAFVDTPWINKLVNYVKTALQSGRVQVIGVCFGHQITARALGANVGRNPNGWEVAVNDVTLSKRGQQLFDLESLKIHEMHRDMVYEYPKGIEPLGHSALCPTQGMYSPRHVLSLQGHPEFNAEIMREVLEIRHSTGFLSDEEYKTYISRIDAPHDGLTVGGAFIRFLLNG